MPDESFAPYGESAQGAPSRRFDRSAPVDSVGIEERAAELGRRSLETSARVAGLALVVRMIDLTTLEGADTAQVVRQLCRRAMTPLWREGERDPVLGPCAAVCVYPDLVPTAKRALVGSSVQVASVATAFPSGQSPLDGKLAELRSAVDLGADEIDMVIHRGAMLTGDHARVFDEIAASKEACGGARLKVILETGELGSYDMVRKASDIALAAGADFVKTSTGKIQPAATPGVALVLLESIRDHFYATGRRVGLKVAGGVRTAKQALHYLVLVKETLGDAWLTPAYLRFGASALLGDIVAQIDRETAVPERALVERTP